MHLLLELRNKLVVDLLDSHPELTVVLLMADTTIPWLKMTISRRTVCSLWLVDEFLTVWGVGTDDNVFDVSDPSVCYQTILDSILDKLPRTPYND